MWSRGKPLLSFLQGCALLESRVLPDLVLLPSPPAGQDLRIRSCTEQLVIEESVLEGVLE